MAHAFSDYDLWKAYNPMCDYDEPEFECMACQDTARLSPDELCPYCQREVTLDDLEEVASHMVQKET